MNNKEEKVELTMSLLKSAVKYSAAKTVTDKALGKGVLSSIAAASIVQKSNARGKARRNHSHR